MLTLTTQQTALVKYWLPALAAGFMAWLAFLLLGSTPLVRASGLALCIVGIALSLRRLGAVPSFAGALTLAFSPAFWSQTGGGSAGPATIVIAVVLAVLAALLALVASRRPYLAVGLAVLVFVGLFWSQVGTPRSLRLTSLVTTWLLFIVVDMLLLSNPHPDDPPAKRPQRHHIWGMLLLIGIGIINDPLLGLLCPALMLALLLSYVRLPLWYWGLLLAVTGLGMYGIFATYVESGWITPHIWRDAERWIDMVVLVVNQFSAVGVLLGVLGIARLARWYPPLGTTTMIAYAAYTLFGLVYTGPNREILLLPLLIVQVVWMTYAVFTIGQWAAKQETPTAYRMRRLIYLAYLLMPALLLFQIVRV